MVERKNAMPHPIDVHVGLRMREARAAKGLSQEKLANKLGISFQQVQKYEKGANRIGSSRLWSIAQALDVPVSFFFEEMERGVKERGTELLPPRTIHLAKQIDSIENDDIRNQVLNLIKVCAGND
ncbi:helix-turn-helix transcriptional regulator [Rhodospirillaceae bacterium KN72]|uniref:Helix-turn-helix transcriptional regulator n=2 Tax=Pacificispira spongiicola TaxID=2729598 RepID=A0A7Y0E146_9PROT|nr:helix-turn-helix transcriptional regulator [Pacificispira spongiicola]